MPLSYQDVSNLYDSSPQQDSFPDWAAKMDQLTGGTDYSTAAHDPFKIKAASAGIDKLLEASGIPAATEEAGRQIGSVVGAPEVGAAVGKGIPRSVVNFAPLLATDIAAPPVGLPLTAAALGLTGALSGAEAYTSSGSPTAGLISGATNVLMPGVAGVGERLAAKALGSRLVEGPISDAAGNILQQVKQYVPETIPQKIGAFAGGQVAAAGLGEAGTALQEKVQGQPITNPFSAENLLNLTLGQAPFFGIHAAGKLFGRGESAAQQADTTQAAIDASAPLIALKKARDDLAKQPEPPDVEQPETVTPELVQEKQNLLSQLRGQQIAVKLDPNLTPEDRFIETNKLLQQEGSLRQTFEPTDSDTILGNTITPEEPRQEVYGRQLFANANSTYRAVLVSDNPANPPELQGQVVGYSTKNEPAPVAGVQTQETGETKFSLPDPQWQTVKPANQWFAKKGVTPLPTFEQAVSQPNASVLLPDGTNQPVDTVNPIAPNDQVRLADGSLVNKEDVQGVLDANNKPIQVATAPTAPAVTQPELPPQAQPLTEAELSDHLHELEKVQLQAAAAQTPADVQQATVGLNAVEYENNLPPTNDATTSRIVKALLDAGVVDPENAEKVAVIVAANRTARKLKAKQEAGPSLREQEQAAPELAPEEAARVAALMGQDVEGMRGYSVQTFDKLSHGTDDLESQTANDVVVNDNVVQALRDPAALEAYNSWEGRNDYSFAEEAQNFSDIADKFDIAHLPYDEVASYLNEAYGTSDWNAASVKEFMSRPHVEEWTNELDRLVGQAQQRHNAPMRIPAGGGYIWGIKPTDEIKGMTKTGILPESKFANVGSVSGAFSKDEMALMKSVVPDAFSGGNVDVNKLQQGLRDNGPVVETKHLVPGKAVESRTAMQRSQHELETLGYRPSIHFDEATIETSDGKEVVDPSWFDEKNFDPKYQVWQSSLPQEHQRLMEEWGQHANTFLGGEDETAGGFRWVGPKPEDQMPGYVEGLVRLPLGARKELTTFGPHFGREDKDVLSFFRGYNETLPNGEKAFHVIEVQSDWAQRNRERTEMLQANAKAEGKTIEQYLEENPELKVGRETHPLLGAYETLALKSAIQHAKEVGATKLIVSDAPTAMMTEGHDRAGAALVDAERKTFFNKASAENVALGQGSGIKGEVYQDANGDWRVNFPNKVPQEQGMRLHYDQTIPSAMERLTGDKGQVIDLGLHKEVAQYTDRVPTEPTDIPAEGGLHLRGSPVFKDALGNPKTNITGRMYDLSQTPGEFTMMGRSRAGEIPETRYENEQPFVPETQLDKDRVQQLGLDQGGRGLVNYLANSSTPLYKVLAADLSKFGDSLDRISANVAQIDGASYAQRDPNTGRITIGISHGHLRSTDFGLGYSVAHELIHGLTQIELDRPTNAHLAQQFSELRQRAVAFLPEASKKAYDQAVASDWITKYSEGKVPFDSIQGDQQLTSNERNVLYGMMDDHEFVAQALSLRDMQRFLQNNQVVRQETFFNRFSNLVKYMLGIGEQVTGNQFEEFLGLADQLMQRSDYVSSLRNYTDRYFENMGMTPNWVDASTQRALGIVLDSRTGTSPEDIVQMLNMPGGNRTPEWTVARRDMIRTFNEPGSENFATTTDVLNELGYEPNRRGLDQMVDDVMLGRMDDVPETLAMLSEPASRYVYESVKDARNILSAIDAATNAKNQDTLNIYDPKVLRPAVEQLLKEYQRVLDVQAEQKEATMNVQALHAIEPDGFMDKFASTPSPAGEAPVDDFLDTTPKERSWFKNFLQQTGQLVRENPETAEAVSRGYELAANTRNMALQSLKVFGIDLGEGNLTTKKAVKAFGKLISDKKLANGLNDWMYLNNKIGGDSVQLLHTDHPEVAKMLESFTPKERNELIDLINKQGISTQAHQQQMLDTMLRIASSRGALMPMLDQKLKMAQGVDLSRQMIDAALMDRSDPQQAQIADAQMAAVERKMTPDAYVDLLKFTLGEVQKYNLWKDHFAKNPFWASAQRLERFVFDVQDGKARKTLQASSEKEAKELAKGRPILSMKDTWDNSGSDPIQMGPATPELAARLQQLDENQIDILRNRGVPTTYLDDIRDTGTGQQMLRELAATQGAIPGLRTPSRRLGKGAEELPWLWNHVAWVDKSANYWSRNLFRAQMEGHLMEPEIAANPDIQNALRQHMDNLLTPDPRITAKINKLVATWQMGLSPATAIVIGTHGLIRHTAEFTSMTGKPIDSYLRVGKALAEVAKQIVSFKSNWSDPDHNWLIKNAQKDLQIEQDWHDDSSIEGEGNSLDFKRVLMKNKTQTLGQRFNTMAGNMSTVSMWMVQHARMVQEQIALLASFDYYKEQGLDNEAAKTKAYEFNQAVNPVGGKAQRPIGAYSGTGFSRGVTVLGGNMKSYMLGAMGQLARHIQAGWYRPAGELTPAEVYNSRKAAVQMLATQVAAAGLMGLPGVAGVVGLLDKMFPSLEVNKNLREWVNEFLGQDKENGSVWSDAAMTGMPSMMGWDWASRLSMGNIVPGVNENNGFQPGLLLGPAAGVVSNLVNGVKQVVAGDPGGVVNFLPTGVKKLVNYATTGGQVQDYQDRPLFQPNAIQSTGIALGFNPKQLSDINAASRIARQAQDNVKKQQDQFHQQQAQNVLKGNFGDVRQALLDRARTDPTYDPRAGVKDVAQAAEDATFPRDLRREGPLRAGATREALLKTFNLPATQPDETTRLQFRQSIAQRLGLPVTSGSEALLATVMDQLRRQNPDSTRAELRRQAELLLRGQRPRTLASLSE